jgi:stage III sporulation protein AB
MMKVVGAGLLMLSCSGIGFAVARQFRERPRHLRALMHALRLLQTEVEYSITPFPQALERVSERSQAPANVIFGTAAKAILESEGDAASALDEGAGAGQSHAALQPQDYEVLREFGRTLGNSDRIHQMQHFEVALARLEGLEEEARISQQRHERLWQYIGVLAGLMLVILFY